MSNKCCKCDEKSVVYKDTNGYCLKHVEGATVADIMEKMPVVDRGTVNLLKKIGRMFMSPK